MFTKILIANRGEIAVRVMRTARAMGIKTVAVHSDADRRALHAANADEAIRIGPPAASESYLRIDAIIAAAKHTGAEAIHPGYGFLSENAAFVDAVEAAGLVFIGPSAHSIRAMGLKDAAKALMEKAGVPVVPGYHGNDQSTEHLRGEAARIGYPVMIKASAGGGGKGMRRVESAADFDEALAGARREAKHAFGDDRVLIEKYLAKPRHIEFQVFGDRHGNIIHLFERDCSLQRRHQKVIEEAPAPGMTKALRATMGKAAVAAARAVKYINAGTIEFIVDVSDGLRADRFYFMEMNTRLQVEHPVTEAITGLDLVEWQLRVAAGERLPKLQHEVAMEGHAMEARLYAEDPARGFLPQAGRLSHLEFPWPARVDSGVRQGDTITPNYDPLIAKIIERGDLRQDTAAKLAHALRSTKIAGCRTNLAFLERLVRHADFDTGDVDTGLIARNIDALTPKPPPEAILAAAMQAAGYWQDGADMQGLRLWGGVEVSIPFEFGTVTLSTRDDIHFNAAWPGGAASGRRDSLDCKILCAGDGEIAVLAKDGIHEFPLARADLSRAGASAGVDVIRAPMPGLVRLVHVKPGDAVARGDALAVTEAMKMEHTLRSPRDAVVKAVPAAEGDQVQEGAVLIELVPADG